MCRQELGDREADAELLANGAEWQVGDRRHRREEYRHVDGEITDPHHRHLYRIGVGMKTPIRRALNSDRALCECVTLRAQNSNATTGRSSQVLGCIDVVQHVKLRSIERSSSSIRSGCPLHRIHRLRAARAR
ncbi:MAG TPA: hypothetical protein VGD80_32230 [Kofleriaceae bacterium]